MNSSIFIILNRTIVVRYHQLLDRFKKNVYWICGTPGTLKTSIQNYFRLFEFQYYNDLLINLQI